jgi:hypothetical protein
MAALNIKKGSNSHSAYNLRSNFSDAIEKHTLAVVVDNEAGVLARVIGLFSGRGYNIDSLTVAEIDSRRSPLADHHLHHGHATDDRANQGATRSHRARTRGA